MGIFIFILAVLVIAICICGICVFMEYPKSTFNTDTTNSTVLNKFK